MSAWHSSLFHQLPHFAKELMLGLIDNPNWIIPGTIHRFDEGVRLHDETCCESDAVCYGWEEDSLTLDTILEEADAEVEWDAPKHEDVPKTRLVPSATVITVCSEPHRDENLSKDGGTLRKGKVWSEGQVDDAGDMSTDVPEGECGTESEDEAWVETFQDAVVREYKKIEKVPYRLNPMINHLCLMAKPVK